MLAYISMEVCHRWGPESSLPTEPGSRIKPRTLANKADLLSATLFQFYESFHIISTTSTLILRIIPAIFNLNIIMAMLLISL